MRPNGIARPRGRRLALGAAPALARANRHFDRLWNGDQTDYGLNFTAEPQLLRVKLATWQ